MKLYALKHKETELWYSESEFSQSLEKDLSVNCLHHYEDALFYIKHHIRVFEIFSDNLELFNKYKVDSTSMWSITGKDLELIEFELIEKSCIDV